MKYGFKIAKKPEKEGIIVEHKLFLKARPELLQKIRLCPNFQTKSTVEDDSKLLLPNFPKSFFLKDRKPLKAAPKNAEKPENLVKRPLSALSDQLSQMDSHIQNLQKLIYSLYQDHLGKVQEVELLQNQFMASKR